MTASKNASQQRLALEDSDPGFKCEPPPRPVPQVPMWKQEHVELVAFVNDLARRKVWLPADYERAMRAIGEIARVDSLHDLEGDTQTKREAYAKQIAECNRMIARLRRVRKRAWEGLGWPKTGGATPPRGR